MPGTPADPPVIIWSEYINSSELLLVCRHLVADAGRIIIEADTGLDAESLAADHLAEQRACRILVVTRILEDDIHDRKADVQTDEIAEFQRAHRVVAAELHSIVDAFDVSYAGVKDVDRLIDHGDEDPVDYESCCLVDLNRGLAEILGELDDLLNILCGSIDACDDFDQLHDRSGIEEVHTDDGLCKSCADLGNGQGRCIGRKDAVGILDDLILELLERILLDLHILDRSFNYDVGINSDIAEAAHELAEDRVFSSLLHLALLDHLVKALFDLCKATIRELLLDIAEIDLLFFIYAIPLMPYNYDRFMYAVSKQRSADHSSRNATFLTFFGSSFLRRKFAMPSLWP